MFKKYHVSEISSDNLYGFMFKVYTRDQSVFDLVATHYLPANITVVFDLERYNEALIHVWCGLTCDNPEAMRQQIITDIEVVLNPPPTEGPDLGAFKDAIDDLDLGDLDK